MTKYLLSLLLLALVFPLRAQETPAPDTAKTEAKEEKKKSPFKDYDKVITKDAVTTEGLFKTHLVGEKYYFEVPFSRLDRDMLLVSRIAKIPANLGGGYVNAGSKTNEQLVHWSRMNNAIHLKSISYSNVADAELPIFLSVQDNNYAPLIMAFKIEAFNPDSTAAVIEVSELFTTDVPAISGLSNQVRTTYKVRNLDKARSFISRMASYPENVEVRHDMTFVATEPPSNSRTGTISLQMAQSLYLLPETPMQPRLHDPRVGWFTIRQIDYGSEALKADQKTYLRRWRLEPKDPAAYARGELVEPVKPIVYYLDPATPEKFRPYFRQGIEDWQEAFKAAGFKNAIIAKDAPTPEEDPDWSPEDARFSTVRYVASETRNAVGPSVSDPRSGEIIESDIIWYHNHLRSYRNRYLLETGAANPSARTLNTPDEEIGEMMRRVISHEIGHALGLPHNMKASYAYPVDSLRSASFTQKWGLATTIMDYTRYNYVAQPGDTGVRWVRMLGPYDIYAINWGYRVIPDASSPAAEKATLNAWVREKNGDPVYLFGGTNSFDPSSQTESVGDDPIKASTYALANLKIVAPNLAKWTATAGEDYSDLEELYRELLGVWSRFAGHVTTNVGGVYEKLKTTDEAGYTYTPTDRAEQKKSVAFLNQHFFTTPEWLLQDEVTRNIGPSGVVTEIRSLQERQLNNLLRMDRLTRLIEQEALYGRTVAYPLTEMLGDVRRGIWSELTPGKDIDAFRRNLQRSHVMRLAQLLKEDAAKRTDVSAAVRAELLNIQAAANAATARYGSGMVRNHLRDIVALVQETLEVE
ncbi:zinc-dependent metalloprotease [Neolewinella lacunae]|uniref:Zinc-dependent metalloprotease n=1 Tax=Neolewinella lacunae TaxID=1517758 RepID=A0A923T8L2_9BACT|nr:zinc-dependent metalloprotease [Neolewinella lacunae]MBC6994078.1 zinc-dependent metalloprotease [Neolewinella lacunae]MDN3636051.1 zinc-dependent metalloprotease [Neolewinella lacunae]